jgi:hypothetical protein
MPLARASGSPRRSTITSPNRLNPESSSRCCGIFSRRQYLSASCTRPTASCRSSCAHSSISRCRGSRHAWAICRKALPHDGGSVLAMSVEDKRQLNRRHALGLSVSLPPVELREGGFASVARFLRSRSSSHVVTSAADPAGRGALLSPGRANRTDMSIHGPTAADPIPSGFGSLRTTKNETPILWHNQAALLIPFAGTSGILEPSALA